MRILCQSVNCAPRCVRIGWGHAFINAGNEFFFWEKENAAIFDAMSQINPDIFICNTYDVDEAIFRCIKARPEMKVAMFASAWGELTDSLDKSVYPVVVIDDKEKRLLEKLKRETGKPDFVFIHITPKYLEPTMGKWKNIGIKPIGIMNAADLFLYYNGTWRPELACDIGYVGGYWPYKSNHLNILVNACRQSSLKIKIFGNGWQVPQHLGFIDDNKVKDVFASAMIAPNFSEPHSSIYPDIVERVFKVPTSGGCLISDDVDLTEVFQNKEVPIFKDYAQFIDLIRYLINHEEERAKLAYKQRKIILANHHYGHRVGQMLQEFGLEKEAHECVERYNAKFNL